MAKMVVYTGETESYCGCSDYSLLTVGKTYEVINENDRGFQTDYTLKGVSGHFNSCWFTEVGITYLAVASKIPVKGECLKNFVRLENGKWRNMEHSSTILKIRVIGINVYEIHTCNTIYVLQVKK
ncbi:MAG: hypothetical protein IJE05_05595 [Clostridia bacterium]|nr:hypothetical protein [Clostridia bacterium]